MQNRSMFKSQNSGFANWLEQQKNSDASNDIEQQQSQSGANSTWWSQMNHLMVYQQITSIQENLTSQLGQLAGNIPEAGPLSAQFRTRVQHSLYLLIASVFFGILALVIGLPTIIIRPSKFVMCITISTILAAASIVVLQKPTVFLSNLITSDFSKSGPVILLFSSLLFTLYITIFIHKYIFILASGVLQILCLLYYLATFVPGGRTGLWILLKTGYVVVSTAMKPCVFVVKKSFASMVRSILS